MKPYGNFCRIYGVWPDGKTGDDNGCRSIDEIIAPGLEFSGVKFHRSEGTEEKKSYVMTNTME